MFDLAGVLKDVPNLGTTRKELEYLRRDLIDADPNNFYSLDGIDALAANIQLCGLQQPIVVRPAEGGRYMVVSGHRRRAAIELLAAEEPEKWAEVPCLVDGHGIQPVRVGALPVVCAAMNQTNINVQLLTIEAAVTRRKEHIYQAAMLDPHTGSELDIDTIVKMVDDLMEAHGTWLPTYR